MKNRILLLLIFLSSFLGYMEWGMSNKMFLYQMEREVFQKLFTDPLSMVHPLILFPLIGQLILLVSIVFSIPKKWLIRLGIGGLAILFVLILLAGALSKNLKMILSTMPFLGLSLYFLWSSRQASTES